MSWNQNQEMQVYDAGPDRRTISHSTMTGLDLPSRYPSPTYSRLSFSSSYEMTLMDQFVINGLDVVTSRLDRILATDGYRIPYYF
jgi:hypothetical protein